MLPILLYCPITSLADKGCLMSKFDGNNLRTVI